MNLYDLHSNPTMLNHYYDIKTLDKVVQDLARRIDARGNRILQFAIDAVADEIQAVDIIGADERSQSDTLQFKVYDMLSAAGLSEYIETRYAADEDEVYELYMETAGMLIPELHKLKQKL